MMMESGTSQADERRAAEIHRVAETKRSAEFAKHAVLVAGAVVLGMVHCQIAMLLLLIPYFALDLTIVPHLRHLARSGTPAAKLVRRMTIHNAASSICFAAFATVVAYQGTYITQLAALILLAGHAFHTLAVRTPSRALLQWDVAAIVVASQGAALFSGSWATPNEQILLHFFLGVLALFFIYAAHHAHAIHRDLQRTSERLARAQRAGVVGRLTGGIAHDFNNLLTVMRGNLELLNEVPAEERPALLRQIEEAAMRGGDLVSRLSDAGRGGRSRVEVANLPEVACRAAAMAERTLPANVRLRVEIDENCTRLRADPAQLELALLNLLINARDALPNGGSVLLSSTVEGSGNLRLTVADDGIGMAPDVLARATEAYETTKPAGKGTGLGLAMVQTFAENSGGTLRLDSAPGKGTRVHLTLRSAPSVAKASNAA